MPPLQHGGAGRWAHGIVLGGLALACAAASQHLSARAGANAPPASSGVQPEVVQVAVAADATAMRVLRALLASISANSPNTFVHIITAADGTSGCERLVEANPHLARCLEWGPEASGLAEAQIKVVSGANTAACAGLEGCDAARAERLANVFNFARFHLADLLPELDRVIWMDCDVIVRRPMDGVWEASKESSGALVSAFGEPVRFGRFYLREDVVKGLVEARFQNVRVDLEAESFNDGVVAVDLRRWRAAGAQRDVDWLMSAHRSAEPGLWKYGTQPLMMLLGCVYGWQRLDSRLYHGDLGFSSADGPIGREAVFLHFDGERKPWREAGLNRELWWPYAAAADVALSAAAAAAAARSP